MIKKVFPILALCTFSSMIGMGVITPILPLYADQLGATGIWIGALYGGYAFSRAVFMPFMGRLSDRKGRKLFMVLGLLLQSLTAVAYIFSHNMPQLMAVRILHGLVSGITAPVARAWVGDIAPQGEEGKWMGYFNAAFATGFATGPLLGGFLTDRYSMTVTFAFMGGLNFVAFIAATFLYETGERKGKGPAELSFQKMSSSSLFRGLFIYRTLYEVTMGGFMAFISIYCSVNLKMSTTLIGILLAVSLYSFSLLQILSGRIADRFNKRTMLLAGSLVDFTMLALIPLTGNFWYLLGLIIIRSIGSATAIPAESALSINLGRQFGMASTMAIFAIASSLGAGVGPILSGVFNDWGGIQWVFYFSGGAGFLGVILFSWLSRSRLAKTPLTTETSK